MKKYIVSLLIVSMISNQGFGFGDTFPEIIKKIKIIRDIQIPRTFSFVTDAPILHQTLWHYSPTAPRSTNKKITAILQHIKDVSNNTIKNAQDNDLDDMTDLMESLKTDTTNNMKTIKHNETWYTFFHTTSSFLFVTGLVSLTSKLGLAGSIGSYLLASNIGYMLASMSNNQEPLTRAGFAALTLSSLAGFFARQFYEKPERIKKSYTLNYTLSQAAQKLINNIAIEVNKRAPTQQQ